ncbi:MAG TPA: ABC transporter ATP-binding protein, partial [Phycisphaerae bacterium]|nr:ABC transporter ATP-binding protein [Phycisphaerae bacterium]
MSLQTAVRIENLGKRYRIGQLERYRTLRESIQNAVRAPFRRLLERGNARLPDTSPGSHPNGESIWALKDVCFEVKQGEVLGIIGRNGAGKSTLLKVLSRITEPTEGHVEIRGRVSSLLEVGTGFHPELTGRENVFLNGAILGMSRAEIKRKFDQIVAFSGVEKFLDTPVKRYSSGMSVRLAFAVAAHLEPDILVIDEVLAVGDAAFQKKCLGKMGDVAESGRTVLFVSHNMQAVNTLCSRVLLLDEGHLTLDGNAREVVETYLQSGAGQAAEVSWDLDDAPGGEVARLGAVRVVNDCGETAYDQSMDKPITLEMDFWVLRSGAELNTSFHVLNHEGICLFAVGNAQDPEWESRTFQAGLYRSSCCIPAHYLNDGRH